MTTTGTPPPLSEEARRALNLLNPSGNIQVPRPAQTRVLCVSNPKGRVGKSTTVANLAVALALLHNRVLVIDLDPQAHASTALDIPHHAAIPDAYDCIIQEAAISDIVQEVRGIPNLWTVPATINLHHAEAELHLLTAREMRLQRAIEAQNGEYDYILIDCSPSLGLLTLNALVASNEVLVPIHCEFDCFEALQLLLNEIELVKHHVNSKLDVTTVLLTMHQPTHLADAVEQDVRAHFGDRVLTTVIPRDLAVSEASASGQPVLTDNPSSAGARSYFDAAVEMAQNASRPGLRASP